MEQSFEYGSGDTRWLVKFDGDGIYRHYVLLRQLSPAVDIKKRVPLVMLNPGAFRDQRGFARDFTMRKVREAFLHSGYEVEVLNLFNRAEPQQDKLLRMDDQMRNKNNPLYTRLETYPRGSKIILQWGKLDESFVPHCEQLLQFLEQHKLISLGLKNKDGVTYRHPRSWITPDVLKAFQRDIIALL